MNPDRAYRPEFDQRVIEKGREGKWWAEMALGLGINLPCGAPRGRVPGGRVPRGGGPFITEIYGGNGWN